MLLRERKTKSKKSLFVGGKKNTVIFTNTTKRNNDLHHTKLTVKLKCRTIHTNNVTFFNNLLVNKGIIRASTS